MTTVLIVTTPRGNNGTWAVYQQDDSPREPGVVVQATGPLAGSVASWQELHALAARYGVAAHQIEGAGLAEMEQVLGPEPNDGGGDDDLGPYLGQPGNAPNDEGDDLGPYLGQPD